MSQSPQVNIRKLIEEIVRSSLREQSKNTDSSSPAPEPSSSTEPATSGGDSLGGDSSLGDSSMDTGGSEDLGSSGGLEGGDASLGASTGGGSDDLGGEGDLSGDDTGGGDLGGFGGGFPSSGGGGGGGGDFGGSGDSSEGGESGDDPAGITPEGEPEKDPQNPLGAAMNEAEKVAKETTDPQKILNAIKASIQVNFSDYRDAWPLIDRLKQTENKTLQAVASRLALFIADVLQEDNMNEKKAPGRTLKVTEQQLRKMIREAVRARLKEGSNYVENERMRQEVNMLALEFLEKLTQKLSIDPATLSPEALASYKHTHKQLEVAVRTAASELFQLGAVLKAAGGGDTSDKSGT